MLLKSVQMLVENSDQRRNFDKFVFEESKFKLFEK